MEINRSSKIGALLLITGLLCILSGLAIAYVERGFKIFALGIVYGGIALSLLSAFLLKDLVKRNFRQLRLLKTGPAFFIIIVLTTLLAGANFIAIKYNIRIDITHAKQHTLSTTTIDILKNLETNVKITTFHVGLPPKYIEDLLASYERFSNGYVETEVVDPLVQIGYAAQFGNVITGDEKKVFIQSGNERITIDFKKISLSEELLSDAILKVTREKRNLYFLTGHGEYDVDDEGPGGLSTLRKVLENNNCKIQTLILAKDREIPADCDVLIIAGPKNPVLPQEQTVIQSYLEKGGDALFLIESFPVTTPEQPLSESDKKKNPPLNEILNQWGLIIGDDVVVDLENYIGGDVGIPATRNYPPHEGIVSNIDYTFYIRPRSISFNKKAPESIRVAPLVLTASSENSWAETNKFLHVKFDEKEDTRGPIPLAAVVWEPKSENKNSDTLIIVFTDADFVSNNFIEQYSNADIALNSIGWLSQLTDLIKIEKKDIDVPRLDLTSKQKRIIIVILFSVPLFIAFIGSLVWWRKSIYE